jgi:hypothetical protein
MVEALDANSINSGKGLLTMESNLTEMYSSIDSGGKGKFNK